MMRVVMTFWWGLLAVWLLTTDLEAQAPSRSAKPKVVVSNNLKVEPLTVEGNGPTPEFAKSHALREAGKDLKKYLRERDPALVYWTPSESYVKQNLLVGEGEQGNDVEVGGVVRKTWVLTVRPPAMSEAQRLNAVAKQQAEQRMRQTFVASRLHILAKGLAAIVVLLLALVGYLRLEERTHGIYTHLLRIGMICLVAVAGAGILLFS